MAKSKSKIIQVPMEDELLKRIDEAAGIWADAVSAVLSR